MPCYHNAPVMLMVLIPGTPHGSTRGNSTLVITIQRFLLELYAALQAHVLQLLNKVIPIGIKVQLADDKADDLPMVDAYSSLSAAVKLSRVGIS